MNEILLYSIVPSGPILIILSYENDYQKDNIPGILVGKMSSWKMMKFLISSFTKFWYWTWSLWSGTGTKVGPKQMARL